MAAIGKVSAVFSASTNGLVSGVNASARALGRLQSSVNSVASSSRALVAIQGAQLFGSMVAGASNVVRSFVSMGQAQAQVIDDQRKLAGRLGFTYGELAGVAHAANLSGVSMQSVANAATKADIALVQATNGSAAATAKFTGLGLSVEQLAQMSPADRFNAIAEAIARMPTQAERSAAAVSLFGRAGAQLLPMFEQGAEGIAAARAEAERLGLTLKTDQAKDVETMNDAFTRAGEAVKGVIGQIVAYLSPAVTAVADTFTNLIGSIGGANIGQAIGDALLQGARFFAGIGDWFISNMGSVWAYVSSVWEQAGVVVEYLNRAGAFLSGMWNAAEAGMGMIVLAFSSAFQGLAQIAQSIGQYLGFDTSTIDAVVEGAKAFNAEISNGITENVNQSQADFARAFGASASPIGQALSGPLTTALDQAIAQAQSSATNPDVAPPSALTASANAGGAAAEPQALKAIDSRSSEGLAEMFRVMRGRGGNAADRTAAATERTADGIDELIDVMGDETLLSLEG